MSVSSFLPSAPSGDYVVFGYTPLCGTCKIAERMVDVIPALTGLEVLKVDLNFTESLSRHYQIMSVPVLLMVRNDEVIYTLYRFESVTNIYEIIQKVLTIQS